jgi:hypothetical protein
MLQALRDIFSFSLCLCTVFAYGVQIARGRGLEGETAVVAEIAYGVSEEEVSSPPQRATCRQETAEFLASWQNRKFPAPCGFIHQTIAHLQTAATMSKTPLNFPLNTDHVHLAVPAELWERKYRLLAKEDVLPAVLWEPSLVAVYHATDALSDSKREDESRLSSYHRQVLGRYDGRGVEVLPIHANVLADRYRSVAWFYFVPHRLSEPIVPSQEPAFVFEISFDRELYTDCSALDSADERRYGTTSTAADIPGCHH